MSKSKKSKQHRKAKLLKSRKTSRPKGVSEKQILQNLGDRTMKLPGMDRMKFMMNPKGEIKMSDVLWQFIDPYYEEDMSYDEVERLLMIGIVAWNMSFFEESERLKEIQKFADKIGDSAAVMMEILGPLIHRKQRHFRKYDRKIINFQLTDTGETLHLSVASTLS